MTYSENLWLFFLLVAGIIGHGCFIYYVAAFWRVFLNSNFKVSAV